VNELTCAACGATADAGQRFCGDCGSALISGCPTCGTQNPPGQRFCGTCGTKLDGTSATGAPMGASGAGTSAAPTRPASPMADLAGRATGGNGRAANLGAAPDAPTAERRLVSVLFADLVGFTPFAEERADR
jgi:hypothetical protein